MGKNDGMVRWVSLFGVMVPDHTEYAPPIRSQAAYQIERHRREASQERQRKERIARTVAGRRREEIALMRRIHVYRRWRAGETMKQIAAEMGKSTVWIGGMIRREESRRLTRWRSGGGESFVRGICDPERGAWLN